MSKQMKVQKCINLEGSTEELPKLLVPKLIKSQKELKREQLGISLKRFLNGVNSTMDTWMRITS